MAVRFYLGTHHPHWLRLAGVPLFVSRRALERYKKLPRAIAPWALDSGGFTELSKFGEWRVSAREYVALVRRYRDEIGQMEWAAPQDWMCEPQMVAKTGTSVARHQALTIYNFLELRELAPELPIIPVVQGWTMGDYWRCAEEYVKRGVDLAKEPLVGVGSVCRRQNTIRASLIINDLADQGVRVHGFGYKLQGLRASAGARLASADSLAWSYSARRNPPLPGCRHRNCANCRLYAMKWRLEALEAIGDAGARRAA